MKTIRIASIRKTLTNSLLAILSVVVITIPLFLIGRATLGEGVLALCYLLPVAWSTGRWGLVPGILAAVTATLCFDFLFIPPFYTFSVGGLEGWLILAIFLGVAIFVVERIQASLSKARQAVWMYELSSVLSGQRAQDAVAHAAARQIQQLFQATLVNVIYQPEKSAVSISASHPSEAAGKGKPDRVLPVLTNWGLIGEIQVWRGPYFELPSEDSPLLQNFAWQVARALERAQHLEMERFINSLAPKTPVR